MKVAGIEILDIVLIFVIFFVMSAGGALHFVNTDFYVGFVFSPLPPVPVILLTGAIEVAIGLAVLLPKTRALAGLFFALLCTAYMPLHIWDLFRDDPMIAPLLAAIIRIFVQVIFIGTGWLVWKRNRGV